jgi:hypothetical protein
MKTWPRQEEIAASTGWRPTSPELRPGATSPGSMARGTPTSRIRKLPTTSTGNGNSRHHLSSRMRSPAGECAANRDHLMLRAGDDFLIFVRVSSGCSAQEQQCLDCCALLRISANAGATDIDYEVVGSCGSACDVNPDLRGKSTRDVLEDFGRSRRSPHVDERPPPQRPVGFLRPSGRCHLARRSASHEVACAGTCGGRPASA